MTESANWKKQRFQWRRGTAAEWAARNTLLLPGEVGYEWDTRKIKVGDGVTRWSGLTYWEAGSNVASDDPRLTNAREWSAETVSQAEAEAGSASTRRAYTAQRVFQAVAAWWAGNADKAKLDGIAAGATANSTDAQLRDRATHTGEQQIATVTGLQAALDGKAAAAHLHDDRYYTESETDGLLSGKASLAGATFTGVILADDSASDVVYSFAGDPNCGFTHPAADNIAVVTFGVERMRFDAGGKILVGATTSRTAGPAVHPVFQFEGVNAGSVSYQCICGSATATVSPQILLARHRGAVGESALVSDGDSLGLIRFNGGDGTDCASTAAQIECRVDGTPGVNDMPGSLRFHTTADGFQAAAERMRITSAGLVGIATTAPTATLDVAADTVRLRTARTPASASATGNAGDICWDSSYVYICTATNTWRRIAHSTW